MRTNCGRLFTIVGLSRLVVLAGLLSLGAGCTHVRTSRRNPQTGETWTVYSHTFEDDSVSYCAGPQWGGGCFEARRLSRPPPVMPSQAYNNGGAPAPQPWAPPAGPWVIPTPNQWGR